MKTVKAKIKGTNAILEGCVCDDSFSTSPMMASLEEDIHVEIKFGER